MSMHFHKPILLKQLICPRCGLRRLLIFRLLKTSPVCIECAVDPTFTNPQENWPEDRVPLPHTHVFTGQTGPCRTIVRHPKYSVLEQMFGSRHLLVVDNVLKWTFRLKRRNRNDFHLKRTVLNPTENQAKKENSEHLNAMSNNKFAMQNLSSKQQISHSLPKKLLDSDLKDSSELTTFKNHTRLQESFFGKTQCMTQTCAKSCENPLEKCCISMEPTFDNIKTESPLLKALLNLNNGTEAFERNRTCNHENEAIIREPPTFIAFAEPVKPQQKMISDRHVELQQESSNQMLVALPCIQHSSTILCCPLEKPTLENCGHFLSNCCGRPCEKDWILNSATSQIQNQGMLTNSQSWRPNEAGHFVEHSTPLEGALDWPYRVRRQENMHHHHAEFVKLHNGELRNWQQNNVFHCDTDECNTCPFLPSANNCPYNVATRIMIPTDDSTVKPTNWTFEKSTKVNQMNTNVITHKDMANYHNTSICCRELFNSTQFPQYAATLEQAQPMAEATALTYKKESQMEDMRLGNQKEGISFPRSIFSGDLDYVKSQPTASENGFKAEMQENQRTLSSCYPFIIFNNNLAVSMETTSPQSKSREDKDIMAFNGETIKKHAQIEPEQLGNQQILSYCYPYSVSNIDLAGGKSMEVITEQSKSLEDATIMSFKTAKTEHCAQIEAKTQRNQVLLSACCRFNSDVADPNSLKMTTEQSALTANELMIGSDIANIENGAQIKAEIQENLSILSSCRFSNDLTEHESRQSKSTEDDTVRSCEDESFKKCPKFEMDNFGNQQILSYCCPFSRETKSDLADGKSLEVTTDQSKSAEDETIMPLKSVKTENCAQIESEKLVTLQMLRFPFSIFNCDLANGTSKETGDTVDPTKENIENCTLYDAKKQCNQPKQIAKIKEFLTNDETAMAPNTVKTETEAEMVESQKTLSSLYPFSICTSDLVSIKSLETATEQREPTENEEVVEMEKETNQQTLSTCYPFSNSSTDGAKSEHIPVSIKQEPPMEDVIAKAYMMATQENYTENQTENSCSQELSILQTFSISFNEHSNLVASPDPSTSPQKATIQNTKSEEKFPQIEQMYKSNNAEEIPFDREYVSKLQEFETIEDLLCAIETGTLANDTFDTVSCNEPTHQNINEGTTRNDAEKANLDRGPCIVHHYPKMSDLQFTYPYETNEVIKVGSPQKVKIAKTIVEAGQEICPQIKTENELELKENFPSQSEEIFQRKNMDKLKKAFEMEKRKLKAIKKINKQLKKLLTRPEFDAKCAENEIEDESNVNCQKKENKIQNTSSFNVNKHHEAQTETTMCHEVRKSLKKRCGDDRMDFAMVHIEAKKKNLEQKTQEDSKNTFSREWGKFGQSGLAKKHPIKEINSEENDDALMERHVTTGNGKSLLEEDLECSAIKGKFSTTRELLKLPKTYINDMIMHTEQRVKEPCQQQEVKGEATKTKQLATGQLKKEMCLQSAELLQVKKGFEERSSRKRHYSETYSSESSKDNMKNQEFETAAKTSTIDEQQSSKRRLISKSLKPVQPLKTQQDLEIQKILDFKGTAFTKGHEDLPNATCAAKVVVKPACWSEQEIEKEEPSCKAGGCVTIKPQTKKTEKGNFCDMKNIKTMLQNPMKDPHVFKKSNKPLPDEARHLTNQKSVKMQQVYEKDDTQKQQVTVKNKKKTKRVQIKEYRHESNNDNGQCEIHKTMLSQKISHKPKKTSKSNCGTRNATQVMKKCQNESSSDSNSKSNVQFLKCKAHTEQTSQICRDQRHCKETELTIPEYSEPVKERKLKFKKLSMSTSQVKLNKSITAIARHENHVRKTEKDERKMNTTLLQKDPDHATPRKKAAGEQESRAKQKSVRPFSQSRGTNNTVSHQKIHRTPTITQKPLKYHSKEEENPAPCTGFNTTESKVTCSEKLRSEDDEKVRTKIPKKEKREIEINGRSHRKKQFQDSSRHSINNHPMQRHTDDGRAKDRKQKSHVENLSKGKNMLNPCKKHANKVENPKPDQDFIAMSVSQESDALKKRCPNSSQEQVAMSPNGEKMRREMPKIQKQKRKISSNKGDGMTTNKQSIQSNNGLPIQRNTVYRSETHSNESSHSQHVSKGNWGQNQSRNDAVDDKPLTISSKRYKHQVGKVENPKPSSDYNSVAPVQAPRKLKKTCTISSQGNSRIENEDTEPRIHHEEIQKEISSKASRKRLHQDSKRQSDSNRKIPRNLETESHDQNLSKGKSAQNQDTYRPAVFQKHSNKTEDSKPNLDFKAASKREAFATRTSDDQGVSKEHVAQKQSDQKEAQKDSDSNKTSSSPQTLQRLLDDDEHGKVKDPQVLARTEGERHDASSANMLLANAVNLATQSEAQEASGNVKVNEVEPVLLDLEMHVFDKKSQRITPDTDDYNVYKWSKILIKTVPNFRKCDSEQNEFSKWRRITNILSGCANPNLIFKERKNICQDLMSKSVHLMTLNFWNNTFKISIYSYAFELWACVKQRNSSVTSQRRKYFMANVAKSEVGAGRDDQGGFGGKKKRERFGNGKFNETTDNVQTGQIICDLERNESSDQVKTKCRKTSSEMDGGREGHEASL